MGYIEENLLTDENVRFKAKISFYAFVPHLLLMIVGIGFITIIRPLISYFTTEIGVTNKRFIFKTGLISRDSLELNLTKVENVRINQSIIIPVQMKTQFC
ncbi:PH domain-containing protein [Leptospira vanthielii]|uniref:PH domain protein n=1 Tax=Leptospira vanthielii serovar Holland str. Waz Holland = ATCC 700522 TaxID=1218591 RepID=N1W6N6_9LEPT|nr:PH domain-containing protein [Leptospira vanthielii]EMY71944.1 PH domain protein [Leptospira vanthielii serovar Holland str. Waz Holland = ATCC 700522]